MEKKWQITHDEKESGWHDWAPDGEWMVVDISIPGKKVYDIYLMNNKTKKLTQVANTWKYEQAPSFVEIRK